MARRTSRCSWRTVACSISRIADCSADCTRSRTLGVGRFIITPNQNLVLADIPAEQRHAVAALLEAHGLDTPVSGLRRNSLACVALPTCGLALAESERYLPSLVTRLEDELERLGLAQDDITIRMTGCPNGCARPYLSEIALVGRGPGVYNLYLGGAFDGTG